MSRSHEAVTAKQTLPAIGAVTSDATDVTSQSIDISTALPKCLEGMPLFFTATADVQIIAGGSGDSATTNHPPFKADVVYGPLYMPEGTTHLHHIGTTSNTIYVWQGSTP